MSQNTRLKRIQFVSLFVAFAPLMTFLYFAMRDFERAMNETVPESEPEKDRDWHLIAFLAGGNIIWGVLMLCLIWILTKVPYRAIADRLLAFWAAVDPNVVWEPWQAVVLVAAVGIVLFAIGLRGVAAELTNKEEA